MERPRAWRSAPPAGVPSPGAGPEPGEPQGLAVLLAVLVLLLVGAVTVWQVTLPRNGERLVQSALAATLDPRSYVADRGEELRALAATEAVVQPPAFAVPVFLEAAAVRGASDEELAQLLLDRATDAVLTLGVDAFDPGDTASFSRLSRPGLLAWFVDVVRDEALHRWAGTAGVLLAVAVGLLGTMVTLRSPAERRLALLGWAFVAGALSGVLFFGATAFWLGRAGDDPYSRMLARVAAQVFANGRNDSLVVLVAGGVLLFAHRGIGWWRRLRSEEEGADRSSELFDAGTEARSDPVNWR